MDSYLRKRYGYAPLVTATAYTFFPLAIRDLLLRCAIRLWVYEVISAQVSETVTGQTRLQVRKIQPILPPSTILDRQWGLLLCFFVCRISSCRLFRITEA